MSIKSNWVDVLRKRNLTPLQRKQVKWNNENWKDMANPDGKKKKGTYKRGRYGPAEIVDNMTSQERAYENRKKREGDKKGQHSTPRGKRAKKKYRRMKA